MDILKIFSLNSVRLVVFTVWKMLIKNVLDFNSGLFTAYALPTLIHNIMQTTNTNINSPFK